MPKRGPATEPTYDVTLVLELLATRWTPLVLYCLARATRRFSELHRSIGGVSKKMLTASLRDLERRGLVHRAVFAEVPPRVEYSLTPLGRKLAEPVSTICKWAKEHPDVMRQLEAQRKRAGVSSR